MSAHEATNDVSKARVEACRGKMIAVMREVVEQGDDPGEVVRAALTTLVGAVLGSAGAIDGDDRCVAIAQQCGQDIAGTLLRYQQIMRRELAARN